MAELDRIREDGVNAVIDAALQAHGAESPVPPARRGGPAFYTTAIAAGPVESASDAENAVQQRLNELRLLVYSPQPLTPQEVRTTIRRWIGDGLPAYVKALGDPVAMRAWVATQVRGPARRSAGMTYSSPARPGGRWYDGQPEGLRTATDVELRARMWTLIPWEEIPAWVQPGLTSSLRARLLAAVPGKGSNEPGSLHDALDAAWAAIEAAQPPSPGELDDARRVYGGAHPAQQALFGDPKPDGRNTPRPAPASLVRQDETSGRQQAACRASPARPARPPAAREPARTAPGKPLWATLRTTPRHPRNRPRTATVTAGQVTEAPPPCRMSPRHASRKRPRASRCPRTAPQWARKPARTRPQPMTRKRPVRQRRPARSRPRRSGTSPRTRPSQATAAPRRQRQARRVTPAVARHSPGRHSCAAPAGRTPPG